MYECMAILLVGVVLLEEVWPWWRKHATVWGRL